MITQTRIRLAAATAVLFVSTSASAAVFDHLQCFKIKDQLAKGSYTADVAPSDATFASVPAGCTIKTPAKLLCVDASKTNVAPAPPGSPDGLTGQRYFCYKAKCAPNQAGDTLSDQFGSHTFTIKKASLVCAPVPSPTTTTTLPVCPDADNDTYTTCAGDCDDGNPAINPGAAEICNGIDDNCNGLVDDGNPGAGGLCITGQPGICSPGTTTCTAGVLVCTPNSSPGIEVCNNLDDDCNGMVDEGNPGGGGMCSTGLLGICAAGTVQCSSGSFSCVANSLPGMEACNGIDDDCDGVIDNGNPGGGGMCNTGLLGICAAGTVTCSSGSIQCTANSSPTAETCNGLDDNCNGVIDEGGVCGLANGAVCSSNGQCTSSQCVDGVCCNTACSGICQACVLMKTSVSDGTCANITTGTDPDNECPGVPGVCSAGACLP